jgi:tetratricopeptide (TPR) repeat protein
LSDENKDSAMRIRTVFEIPRPPPGPASDLFNKAESARSNGLYDKALTLYNAAIQAGSTDVRVYLQAGHLYTVKGQSQSIAKVSKTMQSPHEVIASQGTCLGKYINGLYTLA